MYDPRTIVIPPGYGRITFSRKEIMHIALAVGVLTLAFAISAFTDVRQASLVAFLTILGIAFAAILVGFLMHELAHKIMAQRAGAWAEFRSYPFGLLMAIVFAFFGFVFAAPGAVYIQGRISRKQNGLISVAGPLTNIAFGGAFLLLSFLMEPGSLLAFAVTYIGSINLFLAVFNLLPLPPLDGSKVAAWSVPVYLVVFGAAIVLLLISLGVIPLA